jgi:hypothetical protein
MPSTHRPDPADLAAYRRDPDLEPTDALADVPAADDALPRAAQFARLACLIYGAQDGPARWARANELLAADPALSVVDVWTAAAAGDAAGVRAWLDRDRSLANAEGGPHRWTPLLYLTYSRAAGATDGDAVLDIAGVLLEAGADPSAGYLWHGLSTPFTALTGAFGEGEQGSGRQPRHPHSLALARILLAAGADPADGQSLYNRMFTPDDDFLVLLFEFGLGRAPAGPWAGRLGAALEAPAQMLGRLAQWALDHDFDDRVALLRRSGVGLLAPLPNGQCAIEIAARRGSRAVVDLLVADGAPPPRLSPVEQLAAAILGCQQADAADRAAVDVAMAAEPTALAALRRERPGLIAEAGRPGAVRVAAELGFDPNAPTRGATALHWAAWNADVALLRALLAVGADPALRDREHDGTPLDWALHACQPLSVAVLAP